MFILLKKIFLIFLCFILIFSFASCDLNPLVNKLTGDVESNESEILGKELPNGSIFYFSGSIKNNNSLEFKDQNGTVLLTNSDIKEVQAFYDDLYLYHLKLFFTESGTDKLAQMTENYKFDKISICLNDEVLIEPTIQDKITTGELIISGACSSQKELFELFNELTK